MAMISVQACSNWEVLNMCSKPDVRVQGSTTLRSCLDLHHPRIGHAPKSAEKVRTLKTLCTGGGGGRSTAWSGGGGGAQRVNITCAQTSGHWFISVVCLLCSMIKSVGYPIACQGS